MPSPKWTRTVVALAAASWFVVALLMDIPVDQRWAKPLGVATSATVLIVLAFDRFVWLWLPRSIVQHPRLRGTWRVELTFPMESGESFETREAYVVIRQTLSSISVVMLFESSRSESLTASLRKLQGRYELSYVYWSSADVLHRLSNEPHRGAVDLVVRMTPRTGFAGDYWTDRRTIGQIVSQGHTKLLLEDFASAAAAKYS